MWAKARPFRGRGIERDDNDLESISNILVWVQGLIRLGKVMIMAGEVEVFKSF